MNITKFVAEKTNTAESMWIINEQKETKQGLEYTLSCSTGKEAIIEINSDNTYKMTLYGQIRENESIKY